MKHSTLVLLFGIVYAIIALMLKGENHILCLIYACLSAFTAILHVLLYERENKNMGYYYEKKI